MIDWDLLKEQARKNEAEMIAERKRKQELYKKEQEEKQLSREKEKKGIVLLFLSDYKYLDIKNKVGEAIEYTYSMNEKYRYKGRQTNEAPVQYLYEKANADGFPVKKIICIASKKVMNESISDNLLGKTAYEVFNNRVHKEWGWDDVKIQTINYDETIDGKDNITKLYEELTTVIEEQERQKVYIDYTGGMRDINFLMVTIVRHMEFRGIECGDIVYSQYDKERKIQKIIDVSYVYKIMQLINAVNEFVSTGSAKELSVLTEEMKLDASEELFAKMKEFSDAMSLCSMDDIEKLMRDIDNELTKIERNDYISEDQHEERDLMYRMIKTIIPTIREKLYLDKILPSRKNDITNYPWLIKWCLDNNMIQQAMTLYVEKIPVYYNERQYIYTKDFYEYELLTENGRKNDKLVEWIEQVKVDIKTEKKKKSDYQKKEESKETMQRILQWKGHTDAIIEGIDNGIIIHGIESLYDKEGVKKTDLLMGLPNYINGFLNEVISQRKYIKYILYGDRNDIKANSQSNKNISGSEKTVTTYENKWKSIRVLMEDPEKINREMVSDSIEQAELIHMMKYYLAAKMIRNNLNHAGGNQIDESFNTVSGELRKEGIVIEMNINSIKSIAMEGISAEL